MSAAKRQRAPRATGLTCTAFGVGTQAALWLYAPYLAIAVAVLETMLVILVVLTALYANETQSTRAFKLLPWTVSEHAQKDSKRN